MCAQRSFERFFNNNLLTTLWNLKPPSPKTRRGLGTTLVDIHRLFVILCRTFSTASQPDQVKEKRINDSTNVWYTKKEKVSPNFFRPNVQAFRVTSPDSKY